MFIPIWKYPYNYDYCMTMILFHVPPFCFLSQTNSEGYLILKIKFSVTKYLIKNPDVYFISFVSILKNSIDIYVIRHIITKIIEHNFIAERTFLTPFRTLFYMVNTVHLFELKLNSFLDSGYLCKQFGPRSGLTKCSPLS